MRRLFLRSLTISAAAACTVLATSALPSYAQSPAAKPIRIVVPYPAGGATDFVARQIAERMSKSMGQAVIVDNKSGAAGAIGVTDVAKAEPDGHTLLLTINDPLINNTVLFKSLSYDPRRDLSFVGQILRSPALISAGSALGVKNFAELRSKAVPQGKLSYASWGIGGLGHLVGESLNRELKAQMVHVPQRGEGPVVQDLLANTVSIGLSSVGTAMQHVRAGTIVPLAVVSKERSSALPQVPTMRELGLSDPLYESSVWMAMLAPSKTSAPIIQRLGQELRAAANSPDLRKLLEERGFEMMVTTPEQAQANYNAEFEVVTKRIRDLGIEAQ
jgi:tripartite-type tricarboxylate transporter receptor subunit TctC